MADVIRFPYKVRQNAQGFPFKRPYLPIVLGSAQVRRSLEALVDTGADINVLPRSIGAELGLLWNDHPSGGTISGGFRTSETRLVRLGIEVASFSIVENIFAWLEHDDAPLALGTIDFFTEIRCLFCCRC